MLQAHLGIILRTASEKFQTHPRCSQLINPFPFLMEHESCQETTESVLSTDKRSNFPPEPMDST